MSFERTVYFRTIQHYWGRVFMYIKGGQSPIWPSLVWFMYKMIVLARTTAIWLCKWFFSIFKDMCYEDNFFFNKARGLTTLKSFNGVSSMPRVQKIPKQGRILRKKSEKWFDTVKNLKKVSEQRQPLCCNWGFAAVQSRKGMV